MVSWAPLCLTQAGTGSQTMSFKHKMKCSLHIFSLHSRWARLTSLNPWGLCRSVVPPWGRQLPCQWCKDGAWKPSETKPATANLISDIHLPPHGSMIIIDLIEKTSMIEKYDGSIKYDRKNIYGLLFLRYQTDCSWWGKGLQPMMLGDTEMLGASKHCTKQHPNCGWKVLTCLKPFKLLRKLCRSQCISSFAGESQKRGPATETNQENCKHFCHTISWLKASWALIWCQSPVGF